MDKKVMIVSNAKTRDGQRRRPLIKMSGLWLNEIGFKYGKLVVVRCEKNNIVFTLQSLKIKALENLAKKNINNNLSLLQVKNLYSKNNPPFFDIKGFWLEELGFHIGTTMIVNFDFGIIQVRAIDTETSKNIDAKGDLNNG